MPFLCLLPDHAYSGLILSAWMPYFVIASATNTRQVRAIADEIEAQIAAAGGPRPVRVEGREDFTWVLMDYGDFVVHVFLEETRQYYDLERLWADVDRVDWRESASA